MALVMVNIFTKGGSYLQSQNVGQISVKHLFCHFLSETSFHEIALHQTAAPDYQVLVIRLQTVFSDR